MKAVIAVAMLGCLGAGCLPEGGGESRLNVLMVIVDDLRPQLGCYGEEQMVTPHMDRLAAQGVLFERAYCQKAVCTPSRSSALTGLRPQQAGPDFRDYFRDFAPEVVTLPEAFKQSGYHTESIGKVFHLRDPRSWSVPEWVPEAEVAYPIYGSEKAKAEQRAAIAAGDFGEKEEIWWGVGGKWVPTRLIDKTEGEEDSLLDVAIANRAVERLGVLADGGVPFFLAVGFFSPHNPFIAPERYFDLYPLEGIELPPEEDRQLPQGAPEIAGNGNHIGRFSDIPWEPRPVSEESARRAIQGYYAAVSYVDDQIGKVLAALEEGGLAENTLVVLWSDHGYHLWDHGQWEKQTNFERATRVPLLVRHPRVESEGARAPGLVELVDLYPTLMEFCGLTMPEGHAGKSFGELVRDPAGAGKSYAFSEFDRRGGRVLGRSVRSERYRYTEWEGDGLFERELYDYEADPRELVNVVAEKRYAEVVEELEGVLDGMK